MSNILYRVQVKQQEEDDKLIIDSNELLEHCIEERQKQAIERARYQKHSADEDYEPMDAEELGEDGEFQAFASLEPEEVEPPEPEVDYVAQAQEEAEQILAQARMEADDMLAIAESQASAMKAHAEGEGHKAGFDQGLQDAAIKQLEWEQETERLRQNLQEEYEAKMRLVERDLVGVVCEVVEKVFLMEFGDKREIILHLLDNALSGVESSKEFLIRVNETNSEYLRAHKEELQQKVGMEVVLDIVQDPLLDDTQCMIETDGGLFDCSMDVEMRNLIKDIKALS